MHRITTPKNPIVVETAVSGVSTPSSIGFDSNTETVASSGWEVCWTAPNGRRRHLGRHRAPLTSDQCSRVLGVLQRHGISLITIRKV